MTIDELKDKIKGAQTIRNENEMDLRTYIFCCDYNFLHIQNKIKIDPYVPYHIKTLFSNRKMEEVINMKLEPIYFKRLYNKYGEKAMKIFNDNLDYCESRLQIDIKNNNKKNAN